MSSTTTATMFDPSSYDLEGTPALEGDKAATVQIAFDAFELDPTDAQHMLLAGRLEEDGTISITVTAKVAKRIWTERPDADSDRLGRRYTFTIRDVGAA